MHRAIPPLFILLTIVSACSSSGRGSSYVEPRFTLQEVQRPTDVAERWGDYAVERGEDGISYEDDLIQVVAFAHAGTFEGWIENRSPHSIRLIWDQASYVGPDRVSSGVVPSETTWPQMGGSIPAAVIPAQARFPLGAIPLANVNRSEMRITDFPVDRSSCESVLGHTARLILPLEIQGTVNEYTLTFESTSGNVVRSVPVRGRPPALREREEQREPCP